MEVQSCVEKNGKPLLYLVFEFVDTDLKKYIDSYRKGPNSKPLPTEVIQMPLTQLLLFCIQKLKLGQAVQIPNYDFKSHGYFSRSLATALLHGSNILSTSYVLCIKHSLQWDFSVSERSASTRTLGD